MVTFMHRSLNHGENDTDLCL